VDIQVTDEDKNRINNFGDVLDSDRLKNNYPGEEIVGNPNESIIDNGQVRHQSRQRRGPMREQFDEEGRFIGGEIWYLI
jgi:hypothetical protein